MGMLKSETSIPGTGFVYAAGVALFIANDFVWTAMQSGLRLWFGDLIFRATVLVLFVVWFRVTHTSVESSSSFLFLVRDDSTKRSTDGIRLALWTVATIIYCVAVDQALGPFLASRLHSKPRFMFPQLGGSFQVLDLTIGIFLVAVTEELLFRSIGLRFLLNMVRRGPGRRSPGEDIAPDTRGLKPSAVAFIVLSSSLAFGLGHWGMGTHAIVTITIWGILPMIVLIRTGSIWPALIAHYVADVVGFSGIIPDQYYRLFVP